MVGSLAVRGWEENFMVFALILSSGNNLLKYEFACFVLLEDFKIAFSLFIPGPPCIAITPLPILSRMSAQYQQAYKNSLSK